MENLSHGQEIAVDAVEGLLVADPSGDGGGTGAAAEQSVETLLQRHSRALESKGIAAAHKGKIYPERQMEQVVAALAAEPDVRIFLLGGGGHEAEARAAAPCRPRSAASR